MASREFESFVTLVSAGRLLPDTPIDAARMGYEAIGTMIPLVDGTTTDPLDAGPVSGEWVRAPGSATDRAILWLHGGGYVMGSPLSHRPLASRISAASGAPVLLADYRLAPEHPHPAALDDAAGIYRYLLTQGFDPARLALGGESAGAGLALTCLLALRDSGEPLPTALACSSPWIDLSLTGASMATNADTDIVLLPALLAQWSSAYLGSVDPRDPIVSPLDASGQGLPPLLVHVARSELLYDDAIRLVEWAERSGIDATIVVDDEMIHHWHLWAGLFPEADQAVVRLGTWLRERLG